LSLPSATRTGVVRAATKRWVIRGGPNGRSRHMTATRFAGWRERKSRTRDERCGAVGPTKSTSPLLALRAPGILPSTQSLYPAPSRHQTELTAD
jgi:hypothetical protein